MAVWSNEAVTEFISLYKSHPCLWKVKSPDYKSRTAKYKAYDELVKFCKSVGFKSANSDMVKKKIQSLRGAFRKELKKLISSLVTNEEESYKPSLWYFDQLMFTKDNILVEASSSVADNEDESISNEQWDANETIATVDVPNFEEPSNSVDQNMSLGASKSRINQNDNDNANNKESISTLQPKYVIAEKSKRKLPPDFPVSYMSLCSNGLALSDIGETEAFGINVARKLQRMNGMQALYAETVISAVLRKGLLNKLTQETDICDNQCSKNCFG